MGVSKIFKVLIFMALCIFASLASFVDSMERASHQSKIVSEHAENKLAINKSVQSAVRIISTLDPQGNTGLTSTSSGTYIEHNNTKYILTTAHSIIGYCEDTYAIADELMYPCEAVIMLNHESDIALMEIGEIHGRAPIIVKQDMHSENKIRKSFLVHDKIIYTGYPQGLGPFTFDGKIVSQPSDTGYVFAHTYAWSGSSGSGVFDSSGSLVGLITAVSVANSEYGVDVMEDLVIVTPISLSDVEVIFN